MSYKPLPHPGRAQQNSAPDYLHFGYVFPANKLKAMMTARGVPDGDATIMAAIAVAESGGYTGARNTSSGATGLWQINRPDDSLFDPEKNADNAVSLYNSRHFEPWTTYKNGKYKQFLDNATAPSVGSNVVNSTPFKAVAGWLGDAETFLANAGITVGVALLAIVLFVLGIVIILGRTKTVQNIASAPGVGLLPGGKAAQAAAAVDKPKASPKAPEAPPAALTPSDPGHPLHALWQRGQASKWIAEGHKP